ncbi:MAG TPA: glutamate-1-semialdehyde-2,1-aminomutase [Thermodesulfobacteriaceae bacterium]|nr:glutamate-1-semialdehyde-2,1-aminomutase [Thermodesulfobacteriaceae bacterium]
MNEHVFSRRFFREASKLIPGGVNSPVRACQSVGCDPIFVERAKGSRIIDVDGNAYTDFVCSWGPMICGHAHHEVTSAIADALGAGTSFGIPTWREVALAGKIVDLVPSVEEVRLVNSGTEATMSAVRLARGYTGRKKILKFDGCYHGHADSFLVKAGSGVATLGIPGSPGVPEEVVAATLAIPFNDADALKEIIDRQGDEIAAVIVEPVPANMGVVPPVQGFLEKLREWTEEKGILLIFDEVITGFRLARGGAQEYFGILPDLTCLGKIIGGGLPVGAYGGRREIMEHIAPSGPVYQAGTLSGNPLATAAGLATLEILDRPGVYEVLEARSATLAEGLEKLAVNNGITCCLQRVGSMMTAFFGQAGPVTDFATALASDTDTYARFFRIMLDRGIYMAPSQFEAAFVSLAHGADAIEATLDAAEWAFKKLGS